MKLYRILVYPLGALVILALAVVCIVWAITFDPPKRKTTSVTCNNGNAEYLQPGDSVTILNWNLQFMAGRDYHFFYSGGEAVGPSKENMNQVIPKVAQLIEKSGADIVLLQEVDDGAKRTHYVDQLAKLQQNFKSPFPCSQSFFYWKNDFIPHPKLWGSTGMKLSVLSKYKAKKASRYALPMIENLGLFSKQFHLRRAVQEITFPIASAKSSNAQNISVFNTHLSAFAQGTNTLKKQISKIRKLLRKKEIKAQPWVLGGDFNLLPDKTAFKRLQPKQASYYKPESQIKPLLKKYPSVPAVSDIQSAPEKWFTATTDTPEHYKGNRTIDYVFYSPKLKLIEKKVYQEKGFALSDHAPIVVTFQIPEH